MTHQPDKTDHRPSSEQEAAGTAENGIDEAQKARQQVEEAIQPDAGIRNLVMALAGQRKWYDRQGRNAGMVDHAGAPIQAHVEQTLLRMGGLVKTQDSYELSESVQRRLRESCGRLDPAVIEAVKGVITPVELALSELKEKIANTHKDTEYLFQFQLGGALRDDLTRIIHLMGRAEQVNSDHLKYGEWVRRHHADAHFSGSEDLNEKMVEIYKAHKGVDLESVPTESLARFELNEKIRAEIIDLAGRNRTPLKIAKRMPGLIVGNLDLFTQGISTQAATIFNDQAFELGDTDAESMYLALGIANRCLLALNDVRRTKQVIPSLAL